MEVVGMWMGQWVKKEEKSGNQQKIVGNPPTDQKERTIMHVDLNAFFASVEQRRHPELRGKPIAVCGGRGSLRSVVAACSYEAKAFGVTNGMSMMEAKRLCPDLIPVRGASEAYVAISRDFFSFLTTFTPQVEIFSIDEAFMDVTHAGPLFGSAEQIAHKIKRWLRGHHGLSCSIGIAPNKLMAKLGSDMKKPDGLVVIRSEEIPELLERTPVEDLCGIGPRMRRHLEVGWGVKTAGDLGRVPLHELVGRFGVWGAGLHRMGLGEDPSGVGISDDEPLAKSMGHSYTLDHDTGDLREVGNVLYHLCEKVARRMRRDKFRGKNVTLVLRSSTFETISHQCTLTDHTDDGFAIYQAALKLMPKLYVQSHRIRMVGVSVSHFSHRQVQMALFAREDEKRRAIIASMDHINDKFGEFTLAPAGSLYRLAPKVHGFIVKKAERIDESDKVVIRR